jgi:hypothetical protein
MMSATIEADFFPPAVEKIKDSSNALIVDNAPDTTHSVESSLNNASDTKTSSKRAEF